MKKIKRVQKGQTPTLLDTDKANEIIDALNMLLQMQIVPKEGGSGEVVFGQNGVKLVVPSFNPDGLPRTSLTYCEEDENGNKTRRTKTFLNPPEL